MKRRRDEQGHDGEALLRSADLAALLHVSPGTVYRLVRDGQLPGLRVGGQWRFRRADCETWLRQRPRRAQEARAGFDQGAER
jgi:excisionase family DNA binding protein